MKFKSTILISITWLNLLSQTNSIQLQRLTEIDENGNEKVRYDDNGNTPEDSGEYIPTVHFNMNHPPKQVIGGYKEMIA